VSDHVVLLGDSIFDNGAYTRGEPDVARHLRSLLPPDWKVTLAAADGSTTADLAKQLDALPRDVTRGVLSVGGNDILNADILDRPVGSTREARIALMLFNDVILRAAFERGLDVIDLRLVCTDPDDYANPIEPSGQGGRKIAATIASALGVSGETNRRTVAYAG